MGYKAVYGLQWRRAVEKRRSGMRFEEAVRGSGVRAGLVWRSADQGRVRAWCGGARQGKRLLAYKSRSQRGSTSLKAERSGLLAARKE